MLASTSGTTGQPKVAMHFHRDVLATADTFQVRDHAAPGRRLHRHSPARLQLRTRRAAAVPAPRGRVGAAHRARHPGRAGRRDRGARRDRAVHRAHRLPGHAGRREGVRAGSTCGAASRPASTCRSRCGRNSTRPPASRSSTASARRRCCTCSSPPPTLTSGPARPGRPCPVTGLRSWTRTGTRSRPGQPGRFAVQGPTGCRYLSDERQRNYVQHGWNITGDTSSATPTATSGSRHGATT